MNPTEATLHESLLRDRVASRLWGRDTTLWTTDAAVTRTIENRLGWLRAAEWTLERIDEVLAFAREIGEGGFDRVVLLGMGGSSLGVEVLRDTLGVRPGSPELIVLDSTHPDQISAIESRGDLKSTLFVVASKSGTTIEPDSMYRHFWERLAATGITDRGAHLCAITDPNTYLHEMAVREGFRKVFVNPPDIGGRYSALSFFGMVPAALIGADVREILTRAIAEAEQSTSDAVPENPALALGAFMGAAALDGRDKLTLVTDARLASFGYWVEQLVAESTGKRGKGILPVEGESADARREQSVCRATIHLSVAGAETASATAPDHTLVMRDLLDIGVQFYRWEFATAVAGHVLGIDPFDEPNVTQSKVMTLRVLEGGSGGDGVKDVPFSEASDLAAFLHEAVQPTGYIAIMAYLAHNATSIAALAGLREALSRRYHVPVTVGFGPRFLHSTGQLHKGGANTGTFVQLVDQPSDEVMIPGRTFGFRTLLHAQASGDAMALAETGRAAIRIDLGSEPLREIERLTASLA